MKLLVSDYDGTIKTFEKDPGLIEIINFKMNVSAIDKFIREGNTFVISTGRTTSSIKHEIESNKINYNYITSYDGSVTFDNKGNLISANYLEKQYLQELMYYLKTSKNILNVIKYNEKEITENNQNLILIIIELKQHNMLKEVLRDLNKIDSTKIFAHYPFFKTIYIKQYSNKSMGITSLLEKENIILNKEDIFTVGDGKNDIQMIKDYDGYTMLLSNPSMFFQSDKKITSVHRLIKKISI